MRVTNLSPVSSHKAGCYAPTVNRYTTDYYTAFSHIHTPHTVSFILRLHVYNRKPLRSFPLTQWRQNGGGSLSVPIRKQVTKKTCTSRYRVPHRKLKKEALMYIAVPVIYRCNTGHGFLARSRLQPAHVLLLLDKHKMAHKQLGGTASSKPRPA